MFFSHQPLIFVIPPSFLNTESGIAYHVSVELKTLRIPQLHLQDVFIRVIANKADSDFAFSLAFSISCLIGSQSQDCKLRDGSVVSRLPVEWRLFIASFLSECPCSFYGVAYSFNPLPTGSSYAGMWLAEGNFCSVCFLYFA